MKEMIELTKRVCEQRSQLPAETSWEHRFRRSDRAAANLLGFLETETGSLEYDDVVSLRDAVNTLCAIAKERTLRDQKTASERKLDARLSGVGITLELLAAGLNGRLMAGLPLREDRVRFHQLDPQTQELVELPLNDAVAVIRDRHSGLVARAIDVILSDTTS